MLGDDGHRVEFARVSRGEPDFHRSDQGARFREFAEHAYDLRNLYGALFGECVLPQDEHETGLRPNLNFKPTATRS